MKAKLLANCHRALIVDSDPEESTVLELRLVEQGFDVKIARSCEAAREAVRHRGRRVRSSSASSELPDMDGLGFAEARKKQVGREVPVGHSHGPPELRRRAGAFELGVMDFVAKPARGGVLVAKIRRCSRRRAGGARGRGREGVSTPAQRDGAPPDIVQVLFHGRKTGNLRVKSNGKAGDPLPRRSDRERGPRLALRSGRLLRDGPIHGGRSSRSTRASSRPSASCRSLRKRSLLEGMRRMDEGI